ncbi:hypothetical protein DPMN_056553, partial [Dreissena polymorpha]
MFVIYNSLTHLCLASRKRALANSVDPDETPHDAARWYAVQRIYMRLGADDSRKHLDAILEKNAITLSETSILENAQSFVIK